MVNGFTYDEASHIYRKDGLIIPSVTQVLPSATKVTIRGREYYVYPDGNYVDAETYEAAGDHGNAVHLAIKYLLTPDLGLDWDALDESLKPQLQLFEKWMDDWKVEPVLEYVERPLFSSKHIFGGTPDILCLIKGKLCLVDIKTALMGCVGAQTAAYELLYREMTKSRKKITRYCLQLLKDETTKKDYKFKLLNNSQDEAFFLTSLFQFNYLNAA